MWFGVGVREGGVVWFGVGVREGVVSNVGIREGWSVEAHSGLVFKSLCMDGTRPQI